MEEQNHLHRVEELEHQRKYKQMLDYQEKIHIRKPERAFKPYESPDKVRRTPLHDATLQPRKVNFTVDEIDRFEMQQNGNTFPKTNPITAPRDDPAFTPYIRKELRSNQNLII